MNEIPSHCWDQYLPVVLIDQDKPVISVFDGVFGKTSFFNAPVDSVQEPFCGE